jgi:hypothetical protein
MKSTFLSIFLCVLGFSESLFSEDDKEREPVAIEMNVPGSDQKLAKGHILFEKEDFIEAVSTKNGFSFQCFCYMNGQRLQGL